MVLKGKNILLGITASIAAYKAAMLVRLLIKEGAAVRVVMSHSAKDFITPLTLATLCQHPILVDNFDPENGAWNSHISLGEWADLYLIAPATANTIAKMATGIADNLLLCTYLSARCPVWIAPAMDYDMYLHPTTTQNIAKLRSLGVGVIEPNEGFLASGLTGKGRMSEPEEITAAIKKQFRPQSGTLHGKKILITAGATVEPIDPVRYISNYSTGKMGYAIADALCERGAEVLLISGAATAQLRNKDLIKKIDATSAQAMYQAVREYFPESDCAIFCAAVADYTPATKSKLKIKHKEQNLTLELVPTKDIAKEMGEIKQSEQLTIGFALETDNEAHNAALKLKSKNLDAIILNSLADKGAGFGVDTNKITILSNNNPNLEFPLKNKEEVAQDIAQWIENTLQKGFDKPSKL